MHRSSRLRLWLALALLGAIIASFWPVLGNGFVQYDDDKTVYQSPEVAAGLSPSGVRWAFTHSVLGVWDPLTTLSHMLDCQLFGLHPAGHHLVNLALHAASALLFFAFLARTTEAPWRSAFAAALFALHPLRVESVAWVTERKDVLSGFFFLLALWLYGNYTRRHSLGRYLTICLVFALGLMSKSMVVTLPFVLLLADYWPLQRWPASAWRPLIWEKVPLFLLSVAAAAAQMRVVEPLAAHEKIALPYRLENAAVATVTYLGQLFHPWPLGAYYPHPGSSLPLWKPVLALLLVASLSAPVWLRRRAQPYLVTGWGWFLGMLAPVFGLVQSGLLGHADRYTYLPEIGLALIVSWLAGEALLAWPKLRVPGAALASSILLICAVLTGRQAGTWADTEQLFRQAIRATGFNPLAHLNLSEALWEKGNHAEALEEMQTSLREAPYYGEGHLEFATMLEKLDRREEAFAEARQAVQLLPDSWQAEHALGLLYAHAGRMAEAIPPLREACRLGPEMEPPAQDLALVLQASGQPAEALAVFRTLAQKSPGSAAAHLNLASALFSAERNDEAGAEFSAAIHLDSRSAAGHNGLGSVLFLQGKLGEAQAEYESALTLEPGNAETRRNLEGLRQARKANHP